VIKAQAHWKGRRICVSLTCKSEGEKRLPEKRLSSVWRGEGRFNRGKPQLARKRLESLKVSRLARKGSKNKVRYLRLTIELQVRKAKTRGKGKKRRCGLEDSRGQQHPFVGKWKGRNSREEETGKKKETISHGAVSTNRVRGAKPRGPNRWGRTYWRLISRKGKHMIRNSNLRFKVGREKVGTKVSELEILKKKKE